MMNDRKKAILSAIIDEHVSSEGKTVASKSLVDKYKLEVSPATVRNEMFDLEKEGFIYQPHTSAGRIPTEKGWRFYIDNFLKETELKNDVKALIDRSLGDKGVTYDTAVKNVAKSLAELSRDAVFVGFTPDSFYYTGLSNLFRQPEFQKLDLVCHVSSVVDHFDEVLSKLFDEVTEETKILLGEENPFGTECSSMITRYKSDEGVNGIFGILGPMRMDYQTNLSLLNYARKVISNS